MDNIQNKTRENQTCTNRSKRILMINQSIDSYLHVSFLIDTISISPMLFEQYNTADHQYDIFSILIFYSSGFNRKQFKNKQIKKSFQSFSFQTDFTIII